LALPFPVALGGFRMGAPIDFLIIGMLGPPLLPAVDDHLRVHRAGFNLLPVVIGAATPLALRVAANALLESVRGRVEASLAVWAAMGRLQCGSSEIGKGSQPLSKQIATREMQQAIEAAIEYLPRPRRCCGHCGPKNRQKCGRFIPVLTPSKWSSTMLARRTPRRDFGVGLPEFIKLV
jgi:hypothetical protein